MTPEIRAHQALCDLSLAMDEWKERAEIRLVEAVEKAILAMATCGLTEDALAKFIETACVIVAALYSEETTDKRMKSLQADVDRLTLDFVQCFTL